MSISCKNYVPKTEIESMIQRSPDCLTSSLSRTCGSTILTEKFRDLSTAKIRLKRRRISLKSNLVTITIKKVLKMLLVKLLLPFALASAQRLTLQDSMARRNHFFKKFPKFKIAKVDRQQFAASKKPKPPQTRYTKSAYYTWF
jgi:hypothetical protein